MIVEKKYLSPEYLCNLSIGLLRYDPYDKKNKSLLTVGTLLNYFFTTKNKPYSILSKVYESENNVYLQIIGNLIELKLLNSNMEIGDIKQDTINKLENTVDNNSFEKANKFINYIIANINSDGVNNSLVNIEYDKCIKYILLNDSINGLSTLYKDFYINAKSHEIYETTLAKVFINYEEGIVNDDFVLENNEDEITDAIEESSTVQEEVRSVDILKEIRFLEKKRIAILIGASGAGKSMFLCHATSDYLRNVKDTSKKHLVFYFTFENSKAETLVRIIANMVQEPINDIKANWNNPIYKKDIVNRYLAAKDPNTILIVSELAPKRHSMTTVQAIIKRNLLKFKDSDVYSVVLDYIDKMIPVDNNKMLRTDERLGLIADDFKALSKDFDTCGLTVSQFNREGAKKARSDDELASATDIGGGWSKYENADIVITMQVKAVYKELGYNLVSMCNEKHRYFEDGTIINCVYYPSMATFKLPDNSSGGQMAGQFQKNERQTKKDVDAGIALW